MKKTKLFLFLLALLPMVVNAQADQKLINKAYQGDTKAMITLGNCYENGAGVTHDSTLALKWFQKAADLGDGNAWAEISWYHIYGSCGLAKDTARFFAINKEWADKGFAEAITNLASAYSVGYGCSVDSAKALELDLLAMAKGSARAARLMGFRYASGDGVAQSEKKALSLYEKALKLGDYRSADFLARHYNSKEQYKKGIGYLQQGMQWGNPDCWITMGAMHFLGYGVAEDEVRATTIFDSILKEYPNNHRALYLAGSIYIDSNNAQLVNVAKGLSLLKRGDALDYSDCQMVLARHYLLQNDTAMAYSYFQKVANKSQDDGNQGEACHYASLLTENDLATANQWLARGAEQFHYSPCAVELANYYMQEQTRDDLQAVKYLRLAADNGDNSALVTLGELYSRNSNIEQAKECYQQLIANGDPDGYYYMAMLYDAQGDAKTCNKLLAEGEKQGSRYAAYSLGTIYESGLDGVKVDYKKAAKYYTESGTAESLYRLAFLYLDGNLGKQSKDDIAKGLDYMNQSAELGHQDAIYTKGYIFENGLYADSINHYTAAACYQQLCEVDYPDGLVHMSTYYETGLGGVEIDTAKAIANYQRAMELGNGEAACYLGDYYRAGAYFATDSAKAFQLYTQSHEMGEELGTYCVGRSYLEGCGVAKDTSMALPYIQQASAKGIGAASFIIAECYNHNLGGMPSDADSALAYYIKGHDQGNGASSRVLGELLLNEEQYAMAYDYLYAAGKRGDIEGASVWAKLVQVGYDKVEGQPKEAYQVWESIIRRADYSPAYYQLGLACLQGNGCPQDDNLGKAYLDTAVSLGNENALTSLAYCYLNGVGCYTDTAKAIALLEKAADNANISAINQLGNIYEAQGDLKNAVLYYEKGVTLGDYESYCNLGHCYEEGIGVVLNSQKAYELYKYAADHGSTRGYRNLANCYFKGIYVEPDMLTGMAYLTEAAEAGDVLAMYYCGIILLEGEEGLAPNPKKGMEWLNKAAQAGYEPAAALLSQIK